MLYLAIALTIGFAFAFAYFWRRQLHQERLDARAIAPVVKAADFAALKKQVAEMRSVVNLIAFNTGLLQKPLQEPPPEQEAVKS